MEKKPQTDVVYTISVCSDIPKKSTTLDLHTESLQVLQQIEQVLDTHKISYSRITTTTVKESVNNG
jgi:hypothetical protein